MKMTTRQLGTIKKWMKAHRVIRLCPLCKSNRMKISPSLVFVAECGSSKSRIPSHTCKLVMRGCEKCGHVQFFGAQKMGVDGK